MNITLLQRFVTVVAEDLHFPRAAEALGIPLAVAVLVDRQAGGRGRSPAVHSQQAQLDADAGRSRCSSKRRSGGSPRRPPPRRKPKVPAGGKAKASKGKGRAPAVKGQPKPFKKRQGR